MINAQVNGNYEVEEDRERCWSPQLEKTGCSWLSKNVQYNALNRNRGRTRKTSNECEKGIIGSKSLEEGINKERRMSGVKIKAEWHYKRAMESAVYAEIKVRSR